MKLRSLAGQTAWHGAVRIVSSAFSFLLFALIAKRLQPEQSQAAFFFLFSLGFGAATLRLLAQLAAGIRGKDRASIRMQAVCRGIWFTASVLPAGLLLLAWSLWRHSNSAVVLGAALFLVAIGSLDADLLRGVVKRGPLFPTAFALGSVLACAGIAAQPILTVESACLWLLMQWLPPAVVNIFVLMRLRATWSRHPRLRDKKRTSAVQLGSLAILALFDGIVLNAPFLGWLSMPQQTALDLSLAMRIFSASLPMQPLLLHWSNSSSFANICDRIKLKPTWCFFAVLCISGIMAGSAFIFMFHWISNRNSSTTAFLTFTLLLCAYSLYAAQMRLNATQLGTRTRMIILTSMLSIFFTLLFTLQEPLIQTALLIGALQAVTLLATAWLIHNNFSRETFSHMQA